MIFIALTFIAAFLIEGLGTLVSVIGLSTLFGANPIIIALAVALDIGKLVVVSLLYTHWKALGKLMKAYALTAAVITMIITSAGAAGYLSGEFQKAIIGTQEVSLKVDVLKTEQAKLEIRKKQIDDSIATIPDRYTANQKIRLINQFKEEQKQVTARLMEISKQLPDMQIQQIGVEAKAGPILYIAKAFDVPVEVAVKYVILMIIFVFDPLAVFLIIAGNFLLHQRKVHKETSVTNADLFEEEPTVSGASADAMPSKLRDYPDASQARSHTLQDLIDEGSPDSFLISAGYESHQPGEKGYVAHDPADDWIENHPKAQYVDLPCDEGPSTLTMMDATRPIFEVLQPTPVSPNVPPAVEPPAPPPVRAPEEREQITLDRLRGKQAVEEEPDAEPLHHSILNDVKADDSLTFEENPRSTPSRIQYTNYAQR